MHVLVAAHDCYPDPGSGGTGRYVHETARRLVDRGHRVTVVTRRRGDRPDRETTSGIEVRRYDVPLAETPGHRVLARLPGAARAVVRHVRAAADGGAPDVLHCQGPLTSLLVSREVPASVPGVCTFHSPWPAEYAIRTRDANRSRVRRSLNRRIRHALERVVLDRSPAVLTLSEFMRDRLRAEYGTDRDATVVPGGVDSERYAPDAGTYPDVAADGPAFLTVRRLSPRMGHAVLLDAFAAVVDAHPDARLSVAGDGPLRDRLRRQARRLGIDDRVSFLGYVPDDALPGAYASADVFVLPTTELEGFGLATLEALAAGTPVVGTDAGATPEVLGSLADRPGVPEPLLVAANDPAALASRMSAWATLDDEERNRAGRACRRYVRERYPWRGTVDGLETAYERAVRGD